MGESRSSNGVVNDPLTVGSGEFLPFEFPLAYFLEKHGYDVTYCSNADLLSPDRGLKTKCYISVGHDEYWDIRHYKSVVAMRDAGVSLLFLSGNAVCWVSPFKPSSDGRPNRIIFRGGPYGADYKYAVHREKEHGPFPERGPDEGFLMGARNISPVNGGGDWVCAKPDHWIFEGTGMEKGRSHSRSDRLGISRRPARYPRSGSGRRGHGPARWNRTTTMDGHRLSRTQRQLRLQCLNHLLGPGASAPHPATRSPGRTGRVPTAPTNASSGSRTTC